MSGKSIAARALLAVLFSWLLAMGIGALAGCSFEGRSRETRIEVVCYLPSGGELYRNPDALVAWADKGTWYITPAPGEARIIITGTCARRVLPRGNP